MPALPLPRLLVALVTVAVLVAGCGGNDEEAQASQAIADAMMEANQTSTLLKLEQTEAACIGTEMVDGVGVDNLRKYGILTADNKVDKSPTSVTMSNADAGAATDAIFSCTDVKAMLNRQLTTQLASAAPEVSKCIQEVLTDERLRTMFVSLFRGRTDEAQTGLLGPMAKCGPVG